MSFGQVAIPYTNNFDNLSDTVGWDHYALSGVDDWEMGYPGFGKFFGGYSAPNAWVTNLYGTYATNSDRVLETPYFDLTDTTTEYILSFRQKRHSAGTSGISYKMEYSNDLGVTWQLLNDPFAQKKNWQSFSGFTGDVYNIFHYSAIDLGFVQGQDSIVFRFRYTTGNLTGSGWLIDNFSINQAQYNVKATVGTPVVGINKNFTNFTVESDFIFDNQWNSSQLIFNDFYFSLDSILDSGDTYLGPGNINTSTSNLNWDKTFPLPLGLSAGKYYVIYELDVNDSVIEYNELDNSAYTVLYLDSIYSTPYVFSFDTIEQIWNRGTASIGSNWLKGDPNNFHLENPRSGDYAWYSGPSGTSNEYLESPYLDMTTSTNNVLCFWYKNSSEAWFAPNFILRKPLYGSGSVEYPIFFGTWATSSNIPHERNYGWECYCEDVSQFDNEISTKFLFEGSGDIFPNTMDQSMIDDIYIGSPLPDISIEGNMANRFTSALTTSEILNYKICNSGLAALPSTVTEFYWSNDSIFDVGDLLLGSNTEPVMTDTSFQWREFSYTKPTALIGKYYIFYKTDALETVSEMREYDNAGYFEIHQDNIVNLPYTEDFELSVLSWRHSATLGNDEWEWGTPTGFYIDSAFSGTKAFVTNASGLVSITSRMHLYTPIFNLSQLTRPVLEFDVLINDTYGGGLMYSIDGGANWVVLDTTSQTYKRMYYGLQYSDAGGTDYSTIYGGGSYLLLGKDLSHFLRQDSYQGRDYEENHHYVIDLTFLQAESQVQFMYVYGNGQAATDGMMIDNFQIREGEVDLMSPTQKKFMVSNNDQFIK
ncbi:MAG: hypothetical protein JKY54_13540, partial [Flavobacteriales bacterium]|nr:hypothetical protein [Flavobacteriales bacterium]